MKKIIITLLSALPILMSAQTLKLDSDTVTTVGKSTFDKKNIYELPYSVTGTAPDWHRMWINTATLSGAFVGTLIVLECLPEDATSWNRAELQDVPLFKRWYNHVIKKATLHGIKTSSISIIYFILMPVLYISCRRGVVGSTCGNLYYIAVLFPM